MMYRRKMAMSARAFTLIELMVSVGIMTLVLGITLMQRPDATLRLSLTDSAYSLELMVRQAQLQGSSINSSGNAYGGAGVYLDLATSTVALHFRDRVDISVPSALGIGNGLYDSNPKDEKDETLTFLRGSKIKKLCVSVSTSTFLCNSDNDPAVKNLTLSFNRPLPTMNIYINNAKVVNYGSACIQVETAKAPDPGHVRSLYVYRAGLVTEKLGACL